MKDYALSTLISLREAMDSLGYRNSGIFDNGYRFSIIMYPVVFHVKFSEFDHNFLIKGNGGYRSDFRIISIHERDLVRSLIDGLLTISNEKTKYHPVNWSKEGF